MLCYDVDKYRFNIIVIPETKLDSRFVIMDFQVGITLFNRKYRYNGDGGVIIATSNLKNKVQVIGNGTGSGESLIITIEMHPLLIINLVTFCRPEPDEYDHTNLPEILIGKDSLMPSLY